MNIRDGEARLGWNVSRETSTRLDRYSSLLAKWNPRINLVSPASLAQLSTRHIADSIQVFRAAPAGKTWLDLGTGAGFPGLIAAILAADERPEMSVTLIESDQRKAAFLRMAAIEAGVTCEILARRIETVEPQSADILSARALADLSTLLGYAERHLSPTGTALFPKGVSWEKEIEAAQRQWRFTYEPVISITEPGAVILRIEGVQRA